MSRYKSIYLMHNYIPLVNLIFYSLSWEFYEAPLRENLEIYDRVGGGDSFVSGLIYAFLEGKSPQEAVNYGAAPERSP